ncbi:energy transducer TonB [Daejeonella oryzae]|uniref:energy transducer TonB n=1 Tax=Daejeonella oryzae TaxID=1122943 RepID=UPI0004080B03|nr:energy transducer TonB [Daejeonella oryzae]
MKLNLLLILFLTTSIQSFAQKRNIYLLKNDGRQVQLKDSADFIRIIQEPDSGSTFFKVLEFYPDNSRKFIGEASSFEPKLIFEGPTILYHKNGKKSENISYLKGVRNGMAYFFYPNGQLKKVLEYNTPDGMTEAISHNQSIRFKVMEYYDASGSQQVKDGNGYAVIDENDGIHEEGKYLNGRKDSMWKGSHKLDENTRHYQESYNQGKLISGIQTLPDGTLRNYTQLMEFPEYKGGIKNFYAFLGKNFMYPSDARKNGIQGKLILGFIVKADGNIQDIKVHQSVSPSIDQEGIRVLKKAGKWIPGKFRGQPTNVSYVIPLSLNLN